jgi:hypothetical protein
MCGDHVEMACGDDFDHHLLDDHLHNASTVATNVGIWALGHLLAALR